LKIAVDARTMASRPSGVVNYLSDFLKALFQRKEFDVILICDVAESEAIRFFLGHSVPVFCYGKRVFRSAGVFAYFSYVRKILLSEKPDCFWEPNNLFPFPLTGFHGKVILTVHDLFPITMPQYYSRRYRFYFRTCIRMSLKQVDAVLYNSQETKRVTEEYFPFLKQKSSFVSYLIVPKPPAKEVIDEGFFLYIGNLEKRKGTDLLLNAWCSYREKGGERPLYLAGNIREKGIAALLHEAEGRFADLHYLGYVTDEEKYDLLSRCHCFVFPSRAEGFGLPPLEAVGYGKPVLTSDLSVFREVLGDDVLTFPIDKGENRQMQILSQILLDEHVWSKKLTNHKNYNYAEVLGRYIPETLSERLATFFYEIVYSGSRPFEDRNGSKSKERRHKDTGKRKVRIQNYE